MFTSPANIAFVTYLIYLPNNLKAKLNMALQIASVNFLSDKNDLAPVWIWIFSVILIFMGIINVFY